MATDPLAPPHQERPEGTLPSSYVPSPYRVVDRRSETSDTVTLTLEPRGGGPPPPFLPGQFNMLYAFGIGEAAISICGDPVSRGNLLHTVRAVGKVSTALTRVQAGDTVGVRGPYGQGWPLESARGKDVLIVAGGLGLAPLRPAIYELFHHRDQYGRIELVYGGRTPADLLYYEELQTWRRRDDTRCQVTVDSADRSWYGDVGVVTTRLPDARFDPYRAVAFVCGPEIMMRFTAQALEIRGIPDSGIWLSMERNMKCAIGQCGHCQYGPYFVCRDGPVLSYDRIRPLMSLREV